VSDGQQTPAVKLTIQVHGVTLVYQCKRTSGGHCALIVGIFNAIGSAGIFAGHGHRRMTLTAIENMLNAMQSASITLTGIGLLTVVDCGITYLCC